MKLQEILEQIIKQLEWFENAYSSLSPSQKKWWKQLDVLKKQLTELTMLERDVIPANLTKEEIESIYVQHEILIEHFKHFEAMANKPGSLEDRAFLHQTYFDKIERPYEDRAFLHQTYFDKIERSYHATAFHFVLLKCRDLETALAYYGTLNKEMQLNQDILAAFAEFFFTENPSTHTLLHHKTILSCLVWEEEGTFRLSSSGHQNIKSMLTQLLLGETLHSGNSFSDILARLQEKESLAEGSFTEEQRLKVPEWVAAQRLLAHAKEKGFLSDPSALILHHKVEKVEKVETLSWDANTLSVDNFKHLAEGLKDDTTVTRLRLSNCLNVAHCMKQIAEVLKHNKTLKVLQLQKGRSPNKSASLLAEACERNLTLTTLSNSKIGVAYLAEALKHNATLNTLRLQSTNLDATGIQYLASALQENKTLRTLELINNQIGPDHAKHLAEALKENTGLKTLILSGNRLGSDGITYLAHGLEKNDTLTSLELARCQLGDEAGKVLAQVLTCNKRLATLSLAANEFSFLFLQCLASGLKQNNTLTWLDLTGNVIGDDGIKYLAEALAQHPTLTEIDLERNRIQKKGAQYIANALKENVILKILNLQGNSICSKGAEQLAAALKQNKALTTLSLSNNGIDEFGAKALANALKQNQTLTTLVCHDNRIGDKGAKYFADALKQNKALTSLDLSYNKITADGIKAFIDIIKDNKTLRSLDLTGNSIDIDTLTALIEALEYNTTLTELDLDFSDLYLQNKRHYYLERNKVITTIRDALKKLEPFSGYPTTDDKELLFIEEQSEIATEALETMRLLYPHCAYLPELELAYDKIALTMPLLAYRDLDAALKHYRSLETASQQHPEILEIFADFFFTEPPSHNNVQRYKTILSCLVQEKDGQFVIHNAEQQTGPVKKAIAYLLLGEDTSPTVTFLSIQQALQKKELMPQGPLTEEEAKLEPEALAQQKVLALVKSKGHLLEASALLLQEKTPKTDFFKPEKLSNKPAKSAPTPSKKEAPPSRKKP